MPEQPWKNVAIKIVGTNESRFLYQAKHDTSELGIFDIKTGKPKMVNLNFKLPANKASTHIGENYYLAGGEGANKRSINGFWKIAPNG